MNKTIKRLIITLVIFVLILIGMSTIIKAEDTTFSLDKTTLSVTLNGNGYLYCNNPSGETVTWTSSNPSVATVDNYGTVKGVSIGKSTITATVGSQTATCEVSVVYYDIKIGANSGNSVTSVNLVLGEHPTEDLISKVEDGKFEEVPNAMVTWISSNESVVTVDNNGKVTAVGVGTATITAKAAGVSATCEVNVLAAPEFTDFSNAKYEVLFDTDTDLKISGVKPKDDLKNNYYYIITSNTTKPTISINSYGAVDTEATKEINYLNVNIDENYIYARNLDKFVELNQDLYLWVIQDIKLDAEYCNNEEEYISHATKFVVEGKKLTRPSLPQLNLILKSFNIGNWENESASEASTNIFFRFPSNTENRKFKIKIGKVTDNSILQKIQKGDYSGIIELLSYAKKSDAIYTADLTTTNENYFRSEKALFDGRKLLQNKAYYYIYVQFNDENGKYYPIEGVTLGQAWFSSINNNNWDLYAYTADNFEWNNLSSTYTDNTIAKDELPNTGVTIVMAISIATLTVSMIVLKVKKDKYKGI